MSGRNDRIQQTCCSFEGALEDNTRKNTPFMAGHWLTSEFTYETVLLDGSHSVRSLCNHFIKCLEFFDIPLSKVLAVTADNVSPNDALMVALEAYGIEKGVSFSPDDYQVRCMAHILNLAVQDILSTLKITPSNATESDCDDIIDEDSATSICDGD